MDVTLAKSVPFGFRLHLGATYVTIFNTSIVQLYHHHQLDTVETSFNFNAIVDCATSADFCYILTRDGQLVQYTIENGKTRILNGYTGATSIQLTHDCSVLTVFSQDTSDMVDLIKFAQSLRIKRRQAYWIRQDYYVLLTNTPTELIIQVNEQGQYYESVHEGHFTSWSFDPISLMLFAFNESRQCLTVIDLSRPSAVTSFREVKMSSPLTSIVFSIEANVLIVQDANGALSLVDTATFFIDQSETPIQLANDIQYMVGDLLLADDAVYRVRVIEPIAEPIRLVNLTMKSSPIDALAKISSKVKAKNTPEPKKILFHSKVKSSGYAGQTKPRKMFQPVTNLKAQQLKPKKSKLNVAEYNFERPQGSLIGKNNDYLTNGVMPTCVVPTPTGKFLIAEGNSIGTFLDGAGPGKAVATEQETITTFDISSTGYLSSATNSSLSLWSSKCPVKPIARLNGRGAEKLLNIYDGTSFIVKQRNQLAFVKFQIGEKSVLDRLGMGKGVVAFEKRFDCNDISALCCLPSQTSLSMCYSSGALSVFDLNTGQIAAEFESRPFLKTYWMEQLDQHCFITLSTNQNGALLYDQRDLRRAQRRFSSGPVAIKCTGSISYDARYVSYGNETGIVTFGLGDSRPILNYRHLSPVHLVKFKSVSNEQIGIDVEQTILTLN